MENNNTLKTLYSQLSPCGHLANISNYDFFPPLFHFAFVTLVSLVLRLGDIAGEFSFSSYEGRYMLRLRCYE